MNALVQNVVTGIDNGFEDIPTVEKTVIEDKFEEEI